MNAEAMFEELLREIRSMKEGGPRLQAVYSKEDAAEQLAVSVRTLNRMISEGRILTCARGNVRGAGIPRSEIERLSTPDRSLTTPPSPPTAGGHGKRGRKRSAEKSADQESAELRAEIRKRR